MAGFDRKITLAPVNRLLGLLEKMVGTPLGKVTVVTEEVKEEGLPPSGSDPHINLIEDPAINVDGITFYEYEVRNNILRLREMDMQPAQIRETIGEKIYDYLAKKDEEAEKLREQSA